MRIRYIYYISIILLVFFSASCQKMDNKEVQKQSFSYCNKLLSIEFDNRNQLSNLSLDNNLCRLAFTDGLSVRLPESIFPIIIASDDNYWSINGEKTHIGIQYDNEGSIIIPELTISGSNHWSINGSPTEELADNFILCRDSYELNERYLIGLVIHNNKVSFILSDKTTYSLSVIKDSFYTVPSFYLSHLVEKEKLAEIAIRESNNTGTSFIFFSDSHWNNNYQHSPALIHHLTDYTGINKVFFGGDVIYRHESAPLDALKEGMAFQKAFSFLGSHFYCVYGNHDNNSDGQLNSPELHLSEDQVISYLQSQMTIIDRKEGYNFYFDEEKSKTRFIGLDTGKYHYSQYRADAVNTANFLIEALQGVPEDWHIIVISHILLSSKIVDGKYECCFASFYNFPLQIMDSYNHRQAGSFTYDKKTASYDFTTCKGKIEFCIGGHIHIEGLLFTEGGIPIITVPTDSKNVFNNEDIKKGTINEQSISIIVADYSSHKINLFSVGRGVDRTIDLIVSL